MEMWFSLNGVCGDSEYVHVTSTNPANINCGEIHLECIVGLLLAINKWLINEPHVSAIFNNLHISVVTSGRFQLVLMGNLHCKGSFMLSILSLLCVNFFCICVHLLKSYRFGSN